MKRLLDKHTKKTYLYFMSKFTEWFKQITGFTPKTTKLPTYSAPIERTVVRRAASASPIVSTRPLSRPIGKTPVAIKSSSVIKPIATKTFVSARTVAPSIVSKSAVAKPAVIAPSKPVAAPKVEAKQEKKDDTVYEYYLAHWAVAPKPAEFRHVTAYCKYNPKNNTQVFVRFDGKENVKSAARLKKTPVTLEEAEKYRVTFVQK